MLKQILRDMYIDPEILSGLDDTQKQTLFCKMREEQIRRWRLWDQKHERLESAADHPPQPASVVQFRHGADGEPWVWVMGEHENDRTIEAILVEESRLRARQLAEIETKELRKSYVAELVQDVADCEATAASPATKATGASTATDGHTANTPTSITAPNARKLSVDTLLIAMPKIADDLEIYSSVDELRHRIGRPAPAEPGPAARTIPPAAPAIKADVLREITRNNRQPPAQKVSAKIALWEKRVIGEKTNEIYRLLQEKHQVDAAEAESAARKREAEWQEQEARAKVAELQIRDIARKARDEHRRSISGVIGACSAGEQQRDTSPLSSSSASSLSSNSLDGGGVGTVGTSAASTAGGGNSSGSPPSSLDSTVSRPPSLDAVVRWYRDEEFVRGGGIDRAQNRPHRWFHGMLSRPDAEQRLADEPAGSFLVRLSDKIWGYAISYRDAERCKHYLVDASGGAYQFLGANQLSHDSLSECKRALNCQQPVLTTVHFIPFPIIRRRADPFPCQRSDYAARSGAAAAPLFSQSHGTADTRRTHGLECVFLFVMFNGCRERKSFRIFYILVIILLDYNITHNTFAPLQN